MIEEERKKILGGGIKFFLTFLAEILIFERHKKKKKNFIRPILKKNYLRNGSTRAI